MVTDSAQHQSNSTTLGTLARAGEQVRQFICALHGHDSLMHFEQGRVSLLCSSCGYETPGWDVKTTSAQKAAADQARRDWKRDEVPMEHRRPMLLEKLNRLYERRS